MARACRRPRSRLDDLAGAGLQARTCRRRSRRSKAPAMAMPPGRGWARAKPPHFARRFDQGSRHGSNQYPHESIWVISRRIAGGSKATTCLDSLIISRRMGACRPTKKCRASFETRIISIAEFPWRTVKSIERFPLSVAHVGAAWRYDGRRYTPTLRRENRGVPHNVPRSHPLWRP